MKEAARAFVFLAVAALAMAGSAPAAQPPPAPPDLTQTNTVDRKLTYNLGATGLRGWIYTRPANFLDSVQGRTTTASRQILVTHVGAKSPADGVMKVDDVILGVDRKPFTEDARKSLALAIQDAESGAHGGLLSLLRWRAGVTETVQFRLRVLGKYTDTAPYDCPKSKLILAEACKVLEKEPLEENLWGAINALALMAAGNPGYLPRVRDFARKMGPTTVKLELRDGMVTWEWGYRTLFLCEYYLLTGDQSVLHAITEYTTALAKGQSMYGTFGHGIAPPTADGKLHGSIPPYGPVNATGLVSNLAIAMGRKCGVKDPEIEPAMERARGFIGYFVDKGTLPYGEHEPWPYHECNGRGAMAAMFYAVQGDRIRETQFFARMGTAAYPNREYGHTGQGFSYLWTALGANTGGPAAAAAFFKEASWHFDLVRRCDGSFTYDGGEQYGAGRTDDDTYYGKSSYNGLSPNACYVLSYALPLKKICITGRDANPANWLSKKEVAEAIASGRFDLDRLKKTPQELVAAFGDWSPIVRGWAGEELAKRPEAKEMVPQLIALAEGKDAHVSQGACEALGFLKSVEALPALNRLLTHEDRWVRFKAAQAIRRMGDTAKPAVPDLLKSVAQTAEPLEPINWADPIQLAQGQLAAALFQGPLADALKGTEPKLLYPAIQAIARNADGMARATLRGMFENRLSLEDVQALGPDILLAIKTPSPADTMFGNEIRMGGFRALTKHHFQEGIQAGVLFARTQGGHGSESRTGVIMKEIMSYGSAAREALPGLRELIVYFNNQVKKGEFPGGELNNRRINAVKAAIEFIQTTEDHPVLRHIAPATPKGGSSK